MAAGYQSGYSGGTSLLHVQAGPSHEHNLTDRSLSLDLDLALGRATQSLTFSKHNDDITDDLEEVEDEKEDFRNLGEVLAAQLYRCEVVTQGTQTNWKWLAMAVRWKHARMIESSWVSAVRPSTMMLYSMPSRMYRDRSKASFIQLSEVGEKPDQMQQEQPQDQQQEDQQQQDQQQQDQQQQNQQQQDQQKEQKQVEQFRQQIAEQMQHQQVEEQQQQHERQIQHEQERQIQQQRVKELQQQEQAQQQLEVKLQQQQEKQLVRKKTEEEQSAPRGTQQEEEKEEKGEEGELQQEASSVLEQPGQVEPRLTLGHKVKHTHRRQGDNLHHFRLHKEEDADKTGPGDQHPSKVKQEEAAAPSPMPPNDKCEDTCDLEFDPYDPELVYTPTPGKLAQYEARRALALDSRGVTGNGGKQSLTPSSSAASATTWTTDASQKSKQRRSSGL